MSDTIATYTFLPWLRQGITNKIATGDMDTSVKVRAAIRIDLSIDADAISGGTIAEPISKDIQLYGPGDIIGIDSKAIVKNEPRNWITNFEPNYLPYVEFYDEDFPWRYTPAAPDPGTDRLRPWITFVVLKEGDFEEAKDIRGKPLSFITVSGAAGKFPAADQLWAWAHVHVNESLMDKIVAEPGDKDAVISKFLSTLSRNPDLASSRIVCPMKLKENTAYHAFLVPTFEMGRLAGLGKDPGAASLPAEVHATFSAWADYAGKEEPENFPFYFRWYFRTGTVGDFEYLVRLLQPKPVDNRVGRKDMDVVHPGSNLRGITNEELGGILKLGGALQIPFDTLNQKDKDEVTKYEEWDQPSYPHPFQQDLAEFINLSDDYTVNSSADANNKTNLDPAIKDDCDPLITAPLYGRWHALTQRLLKDKDNLDISPNDNWVHELNLDPRWRVTAGYGTRVIQENQENYMKAAWEQVGEILEANRKMRLAQLAKMISTSWYTKQIDPLIKSSPDKGLLFTAPVQKRILWKGLTAFHQVETSAVSKSVVSPSMRKILRPGGRTMKTLEFSETVKGDNLVTRISNKEILIAEPKKIPAALPTVDQLAKDAMPKDIPPFILDLLRKSPGVLWIIIVVAIILLLAILLAGISAITLSIAGIIAAAAAYAIVKILKWKKTIDSIDSIKEENQTPASVDNFPASPDFKISEPGDNFQPSKGSTDSIEGAKYKRALKDSLGFIQAAKSLGVVPSKEKIAIADLVTVTFNAIDPKVTIPRLINAGLFIPERIKGVLVEQFTEAMAYPVIDVPMYKPLVGISSELFLPNINFIGQNTISLLETNQRFIESYLIGLNHEFARELLWREFPTDQRGSYFRQFWDVSSFFNDQNLDEEALKEKLRDIPPLHRWSKFSKLGDHDNREEGGDKEEEVVLVIRGELLKKYPGAEIYAHLAKWQLNPDGTINNSVERELVELTPDEEDKPPRNKLKTPLYEAKVDPDIYFFGFDLTALEAKGRDGSSPGDIDKAGWFFCIKERSGEPRFGLDIDRDTTPNVWNDLSWEDILPGAPDGSFIQINNATATINLRPLTAEDHEKEKQRLDDNSLNWNKNMNAAEVAYILYQVPVLVAVHASEMLPKN